MDIVTNKQTDALIFEISGRLDGSNAPHLQNTLMSQLDQAPAIILNCAGLGYISSAGLRVLLMATKECKKMSRPFGLCHLQEDVKEVFNLSGFDSIIKTFDSLDQARQTLCCSA
jgi:anti-anti-sigma factor